MTTDANEQLRKSKSDSPSQEDAMGWFEGIYAGSESAGSRVPWDRGAPHRHIVVWAKESDVQGAGKRAIVVGSGLGDDAEFIASLGFDTIGFDIAPSAIELARKRFPESQVTYVTADLFNPPSEWRDAFDLVVENQTVQSLPGDYRRRAIEEISSLAAPGGTVAVFAARATDDRGTSGPPWPLDRGEIVAFAEGDLQPVEIAPVSHEGSLRWRAIFQRTPVTVPKRR